MAAQVFQYGAPTSKRMVKMNRLLAACPLLPRALNLARWAAYAYAAQAALAIGEKDECSRLLQQVLDRIEGAHLPAIQRNVNKIARLL